MRRGGASGKENVGMSNDNGGEKPPRRKTKGSGPTLIGAGSAGSYGGAAVVAACIDG